MGECCYGCIDMRFKEIILERSLKARPRNALKNFLDGISHEYFLNKVKNSKEEMKVPFAQAITVLLFSRSFTEELYDYSQELPEPFKTEWKYPYDLIFTEVVSFYFFSILREYLGKKQRGEVEEDGNFDGLDEKEGNIPSDSYATSLLTAMQVAGKLIHDRTSPKLVEEFVRDRATSYVSPNNEEEPVDRLHRFLFEAWNPDKSGRIKLKHFAHIPIMVQTSSMPIEAVEKACKDVYQLKLDNPSSF